LAHEIDVMEAVIETLGIEFGVSRQAAKIRLVELGFESAIGTYTYVDGHYVRPHSFSKKTLELHQTYTIPTQDALIQRCINPKLKEKTKNGDYLFVENHYVYNAPLYVDYDEDGNLVLTDYARSHMDECCLVFDMTVVTKSINNAYHTLCYLNREPSDITFEVKYHNGYENSPQERQVALRQKQMSEWMDIRRKMTDDQSQCMELLLGWRKMKCTELADSIDISEKTVRRITKGENAPELKTAVRICFALHLPPMISEKLLEVFGCKLMPMNQEHQWIKEALVLKYPESYDLVVVWLSEFNVEI